MKKERKIAKVMSLNIYRLQIATDIPDTRVNKLFVLDAAVNYITKKKIQIEELKRKNEDLKTN